MVKYEIRSNPTGQYYLPKEVREELGPKLFMICSAKAAIVFCPDEPIDVILESLKLIELDLEHRMQIQKREEARESEKQTASSELNGSRTKTLTKPEIRPAKLLSVKPDMQQLRNSVPHKGFEDIEILTKHSEKEAAKILRNSSFVIEKYVETTVSQYIFGIYWGIED